MDRYIYLFLQIFLLFNSCVTTHNDQHKQVRVGDYFQSGGWSGRVQSILSSHVGEAQEDDIISLVESARQGAAIRVYAVYDAECKQTKSRIVGEYIHFFSVYSEQELVGDVDDSKEQVRAERSKHERKRRVDKAKRVAMKHRVQYEMDDEFHGYLLSNDVVGRWRLRDMFAATKSAYYHRGTDNGNQPVISIDNLVEDSIQQDQVAADVEEYGSTDDGDDDGKNKALLIVKTKTDLDLETFLDAFEDNAEASSEPGDKSNDKNVYIISSGVGDINKGDVDMAALAGKGKRGFSLAQSMYVKILLSFLLFH